MKRLLICILAIAMMLSSVAFANESAYVNYEEKDADSFTTVLKSGALKVEAKKNSASAIELVSDPKNTNGKVVKITNPAYVSSNVSGGSIISYFQDNVDINASGSAITGVKNNISYGFSFYAPAAKDDETSDVYFNVNLKYKGSSTTEDLTIVQIKSGKIYPYVERNLANKTAELNLGNNWHDLRFDFDLGNRSIKTYVDNALFYTSFFSDDAVNYLRRITVATTVDPTCVKTQEAYFDNFFVNETPKHLNKVEYSKCIMNDDFSGYPIVKRNALNNNDGGGTAEQSDGVAKFTYTGAVTSSVPSMASKSAMNKGTGGYLDGEYIFEIDVKFSAFNGAFKLGYLKYNVEGNTTTDYDSHPAVLVDEDGELSVGENKNLKTITQLEADKWYNFKFHYKARNVSDNKNQGLLVDVYFQDKLVGENLYITNVNGHTDKFVNTIRAINFQAGTATAAKIIYADNARFYAVNKVKIDPVQIVDVEVSNASGDLISSTYNAGANKVTAYVTSVSDIQQGSVTLVAARYSATGELIEVKAVSAGAITKDTLTKVTANLNAADAQAGKEIKVMIVDSTNTLKPYIKPVTLSSSSIQ